MGRRNNAGNARSSEASSEPRGSRFSMSQDDTCPESKANSSQVIPHDLDYFYTNGDCIVRVEDTLFRVCLAHLVRWPKELTANRYTKRSWAGMGQFLLTHSCYLPGHNPLLPETALTTILWFFMTLLSNFVLCAGFYMLCKFYL